MELDGVLWILIEFDVDFSGPAKDPRSAVPTYHRPCMRSPLSPDWSTGHTPRAGRAGSRKEGEACCWSNAVWRPATRAWRIVRACPRVPAGQGFHRAGTSARARKRGGAAQGGGQRVRISGGSGGRADRQGRADGKRRRRRRRGAALGADGV